MRSNRGQQIGEYAAMVGLVAVAFIGLQRYISSRVAGALIDQSHAALGTMVPLDEGTGSSDVLDRVYEHSDGSNFVTQVVSTATGDSQSGFILAEPPGFGGLEDTGVPNSMFALLNDMAKEQGLFEEDKGYELSVSDIEIDGKKVTGTFKSKKKDMKGDTLEDVKLGYEVLGEQTFDASTLTFAAQLDLNDNGVYEPGIDRLATGKLAQDVLILVLTDRIEEYRELMKGWSGLLEDQDLEMADSDRADLEASVEALENVVDVLKKAHFAGVEEYERVLQGWKDVLALEVGVEAIEQILADVGSTDLTEASLEELKEIALALKGRAYTVGNADDAYTRIDTARRTEEKERLLLEGIPNWSSSSTGQQWIEDVEDGDVDLGMLLGPMGYTATAMENFAGQLKSSLEQQGMDLEHGDAITSLLKTARQRLDSVSSRDNDDEVSQDFKAAAHALDGVYALLEDDLNTAYGLDQPADSDAPDDTHSDGELMLTLSGRSSADQFLSGDHKQYDIALGLTGDTLTDTVVSSEDGAAQGVQWGIFDESDMVAAETWPSMPGMSVHSAAFVSTAFIKEATTGEGEHHEVLTAHAGLPPEALILRAGMHPDDLEGIVAWIPITETGAYYRGEIAEIGSLGLGQSTQALPLTTNVTPPEPLTQP